MKKGEERRSLIWLAHAFCQPRGVAAGNRDADGWQGVEREMEKWSEASSLMKFVVAVPLLVVEKM